MRLWTFLRFMLTVRGRREIDLERIKGMGLLAVKVGQILALRPDLLPPERCLELQGLYQRTHTKQSAPLARLMEANCPPGFAEHFASIDEDPMAAASIGQVHAATLLDGREVVIKFVKDDFEEPFKKDVARMKRWLSAVLFFSPRLRKVGNPMALLNHIETYTLDELDLRNERKGQIRLLEAIDSVKEEFPLERLRFPEIHTDLSSERVLVVERVREPSIEDRIDEGSLGWEDLLQLFRIQGAFMFGLGTFHGDLHPGNAMLSEDGTYTFIDTVLVTGTFNIANEETFWDGLLRYVLASTIGCYLTAPAFERSTTIGDQDDGDALRILRPSSNKLCFPAIPFLLPEIPRFRVLTNTIGVDLYASHPF